MQFTIKLLLAILPILMPAASVTAGPIFSRQRKEMGTARGRSVGAAYFLTNEPTGNFIVAADIGSDGKLNLRRAVDAGGLGAHGITDPDGPDPLFSQGAVKVSGNTLVAVNPGSNTVSVFNINPNDPTNIKMMGKPISSGGEFPVSVALNKAGNTACVLNGGASNGISCYTVDQQKGLVPIRNTVRSLGLNQTSPATGPAGSASHLVFTEDGTQLIASIKGVPPQPGFFAVWDMQNDGSLSENFNSVAPPQGGLLPFGMAVIPGKNAIVATDAGIGFDILDLNAQSGGDNSTDKSSANAVAGQTAVCWAAFSPRTKSIYMTDIGTSIVTEVSLGDDLSPQIVQQHPQANQSSTIDVDIASLSSNDFLYILSPGASAIDVLSLDAPGKTTNIQRIDIAGPAQAAGLKISTNNLQGMTVFVRK